MAQAAYILCALTSVVCAALLLRAYAQTKVRLLLWGGLCFVGHTAHNLFLLVDLSILRDIDLSTPRELTMLAGTALLLYGLVWDARD